MKGGILVPKKEKTYRKKVRKYPQPSISNTDPDGSYTGRPKDPHEIPVQDADDL